MSLPWRILLSLALGALSACQPSPTAFVSSFDRAVRKGNQQRIEALVSEQSKPLLRIMMDSSRALEKVQTGPTPTVAFLPSPFPHPTTVKSVSAVGNGYTVIVSDGKREQPWHLIRERGLLKLDLTQAPSPFADPTL